MNHLKNKTVVFISSLLNVLEIKNYKSCKYYAGKGIFLSEPQKPFSVFGNRIYNNMTRLY